MMRLIDADALMRHQRIKDCSIGIEHVISAETIDATKETVKKIRKIAEGKEGEEKSRWIAISNYIENYINGKNEA